jgi:hypothetical protein
MKAERTANKDLSMLSTIPLLSPPLSACRHTLRIMFHSNSRGILLTFLPEGILININLPWEQMRVRAWRAGQGDQVACLDGAGVACICRCKVRPAPTEDFPLNSLDRRNLQDVHESSINENRVPFKDPGTKRRGPNRSSWVREDKRVTAVHTHSG